MTRVYLETYGCQMNEADSELMAGVLARAGFERVADPAEADVLLLNTCAVREHAEQRVLGRITDLARHKQARPGVLLGVTGCMAQHLRGRLLAHSRWLDLVIGPDSYRDLPALIEQASREPVAHAEPDPTETYGDLEPLRAPGVRAWVPIQRGCDQYCAYCVVPFARGRQRSLPLDDVLASLRRAVAGGCSEAVLLGQTVNSWQHEGRDLADLLRAARGIEGLRRLRFLSPHPVHMTPRLIEILAEGGPLCPQLHLPLQSASDPVLEAMGRGHTLADYDAVVARLRAAVPDLALSTDIIVGFPGETEADFHRTEEYLRATRFDGAFLFKYSSRPGTRAAGWPETVDEAEKNRRLTRLIELQHELSAAANRGWVGREVEALVEGPARRDPGQLYARTRQFKAIVFPNDGTAAGALRRLRVTGATPVTLRGEPA